MWGGEWIVEVKRRQVKPVNDGLGKLEGGESGLCNEDQKRENQSQGEERGERQGTVLLGIAEFWILEVTHLEAVASSSI